MTELKRVIPFPSLLLSHLIILRRSKILIPIGSVDKTQENSRGVSLIKRFKNTLSERRKEEAIKLKDHLKRNLIEKDIKISRTWDFESYQSALRLINKHSIKLVWEGYYYFSNDKFFCDKIDGFGIIERNWVKFLLKRDVDGASIFDGVKILK